jgi:hypothetical protein
VFLAAFAIPAAAADSISVMWNPNPAQEGVSGYMVFVGTEEGVYSEAFDVGTQTFFVYATPIPGQRYFFAVTPYDEFRLVRS